MHDHVRDCAFVIRIAHVFVYYVKMQHSFKISFIGSYVHMVVATIYLPKQYTFTSKAGCMQGISKFFR